MKTKTCSNCLNEKEIDEFYLSRGNPQSQCKECIKTKTKKYKENNKQKYQEYFKEYQQKNKEELKEYKRKNYLKNQEKIKERTKDYYERNKEECNRKSSERNRDNRDRINELGRIRNKYRRDNDPLYRLSNNIRTTIWHSIKKIGYKKQSNTENILGCSYEEFILHIESKFENWMNWGNYGRYNGELYYGWDIDHMIPVTSAKTEEEIIKRNHYTNLQPLCSKINRDIKKDKLEYEI
jgi:hypothetical protein